MKRLFIVGNGFDVAHNIPSKYSDLKNYVNFVYSVNQYTYPNISLYWK